MCTGFSQAPHFHNSQYVLAVGESPVLSCQHCATDDIHWKLNRTVIRSIIPVGINISYSLEPVCGLIVDLRITNLSLMEYNETNIQCIAGDTLDVTTPFTLLVQGT